MSALVTTPKPAGSRRFWVTVLCFAIANAGAWVLWHRAHAPGRRDLLRVEQFDPGDGADVGPRAELVWRFNLDVGRAGADVEGAAPAVVTPAVDGRWHWADAHTLAFVPARDLPRATRVKFTLSPPRLRTADGFALAKPFESSVVTTPLRVTGVRQAAFEEGGRYVLEFQFNDRVLPADVVHAPGVTTPDGRPVPCHALGQAADRVVRVTTDPVVAAVNAGGGRGQAPEEINVALAAGLAGLSGPLGTQEPFVTSVHVGQSLTATGLEAQCPARGKPLLLLQFNAQVDLEALKQVVSVEPAVAYAVESNWNGVALRGDFASGVRYAVKIAKPPAGADPKKYPREDTLSALVPDRAAGVWFEHDEGYLGSQGNRTLLAHAVNVRELRASVFRVYDNNLVAWRNEGSRYSWRQTEAFSQPIAIRLLPGAPGKNREQDLPIALDDLLPASAPRDGVYRVTLEESHNPGGGEDEAEEDGGFDGRSGGYARYGRYYGSRSASAVVTLSDVALTAKSARNAVTVWAVSLRSAGPIEGVRARVFSDKNQLLGEAVTDVRGLATIADVHPAEGERAAVVLAEKQAAAGGESGAGRTWLDLRAGGWEMADADLSGRAYLRQGHEAFVYTDRGVYRPGETVYLRAIVRGGEGSEDEVPKPFPVRWAIRRPDLHDYRKQVVMLDADGAAGFALPLPADLPTGRWTASIGLPREGESKEGAVTGGVPCASREFGSVTFQVEEFVPDRMKVAVRLGHDKVGKASGAEAEKGNRFGISDKPLVAAVQADYLFGNPAAGLDAKLTARIDPQAFAPAGWGDWTFGDSARLIEGASSQSAGAVKPKRHAARKTGQAAEEGENGTSVVLDAAGHGVWEMDLREMLHLGTDEEAGDKPPGDKSAGDKSAGRPDRYLGPWRVSVSAAVQEAGGRAVTVARQIDADVLADYVAVRGTGGQGGRTARPDEPVAFEVALVKPDGKRAERDGELEAAVFRESWNTTLVQKGGHYHYESTRVLDPVKGQEGNAVRLVGGGGRCVVTVPTNGSYILRLKDRQTGALTSLSFYASDGTPWDDSVSREHPERLEVVLLPPEARNAPEAAGAVGASGPAGAESGSEGLGVAGAGTESGSEGPGVGNAGSETKPREAVKFRVGQTARVLVRSPFAGRLLLAVETDGVVSTQVVQMSRSQVVVPVEVTDACRPNAFVTATVVRAIDPDARWRTHRAFGAARLSVDPEGRRLEMNVTATGEVRPRQPLGVEVKVVDAVGEAVRDAAVTLAAVDEGVLQVAGFSTPDPLGYFEAKRALSVQSADAYTDLMPEVAKPDGASSPGGDAGGADGRHTTPVHAKRVKPVSLVTEVLRTDDRGIARATLAVPEFVGKLRVMAVGYAGSRFGSAERGVLVRSPLLVQSSFPRFAAPGDRFEVPLVAFNNGAKDGEAKIVVELSGEGTDGPLAFDGAAGNRLELGPVHLPASGQAALSFAMVARPAVGVAKVRLTATTGDESFEENVELPVRPASPEVTRGGYAVAAPGGPLKLAVPGGLMAGTEALDVKVTPWPVLQLPAGLDYLERYPYGCAEQTISTCFPLAYLGDVGRQIAPGVFEPRRVADKVQAGVYRLMGMQTADGGIAMWPGSAESWPWAGVYAAHFLVEARKAGHAVPEDFHKRLLGYVRRLLDKPGDDADLVEAQAYACYVLALAGKPERSAMNRLTELTANQEQAAFAGEPAPPQGIPDWREWRAQRASARMWLSLAWLSAGRRDLAGNLLPLTPPIPRQGRQSGGNVGSPVRDRALAVRTMLEVRPDDPSLPALVQQLAEAGRSGQWRSTQDTAFAVMAIGRYLRQARAVEPYQKAELLLGEEQLAIADEGGPAAFRSDATAVRLGPAGAGGREFRVAVTGAPAAKAYVTWVQSGVPLAPPGDQDQGMKVRRRYLDESGKPLGSRAVRSGELVRVELAVQAPDGTDNLVIEDLLPAGLEIENPRLQTSAAGAGEAGGAGGSSQSDEGGSNDTPFPVKRLDVRDDRLVIVGTMPLGARAGVAKYRYLARAVAPGAFVVPPVRGECMYDLGVNSLAGGGGTFVVEPVGQKLAKGSARDPTPGQSDAR